MWLCPRGVLLADPTLRLVTNTDILIENGIIQAVAPRDSSHRSLQNGVEDLYLSPGLIDLHVHLHSETVAEGEIDVETAINRAHTLLEAGVTTVRDVGSPTALLSLRDTFNNDVAHYPRVRMAGRPITVPNGHAHRMGYTVRERSDIRSIIGYLSRDGVDLVKVMATAGGSEGCQPHFSYDELFEIVEQAHQHGLRVAAHAHSAEGIRRCVLARVDTIEHASFKNGDTFQFDEDIADLMSRSGSVAVFTPVNYRKADRGGDTARMRTIESQWLSLYRHGVSIGVGTDVGVPGMLYEDSTVYAAEVLERAGIPISDVLRMIWIQGPRSIGMAGHIGIIRPGAVADIIGTPQNPLSGISAFKDVRWVMREGVIAKGDLA